MVHVETNRGSVSEEEIVQSLNGNNLTTPLFVIDCSDLNKKKLKDDRN